MTSDPWKIGVLGWDRETRRRLERAIAANLPRATLLTAAPDPAGIAQVAAAGPDLLLLAVADDWVAGCALCRSLKQEAQLALAPILLLAPTQVDGPQRDAAVAAGADGFLADPFSPADLFTQVRAMAALKAVNQPLPDANAPLLARIAALEAELAAYIQSEASLRKSQAALNLILNTVPQSIFWKDREGRYLGCNQVFADAAGLNNPAEIIGKTDFDLPWPLTEAEAYRADDRQVLESGQAKLHIIEPLQTADGARLWIDTSKLPLTDVDGQPYAVLGVYEDVTDRRRTTHTLARFFDQRGALNLIADFDSIIVRANDGWESLLGYSRAELEGASFMDLVHPDDRAATLAEMSRLGQGETTLNFENRYRHQDGSYRLFRWSALASIEDQLVYATAHDLTARDRAERALVESEERYRALLEQAPIGIAVHDRNVILFVNPAGAQMFGAASPAEVTGRPVVDFVHESSLELMAERARQRHAGRHIAPRAEYVCVRLDGTLIDVEVHSSMLRLQGAPVVQIIMRDITEQKRADAERARLLAELEAQATQIAQILDTVPEGVLLLEHTGEVLYANPTGVRDLKALAQAAVGDHLTHLGELPIAVLLESQPGSPWHETHAGQQAYVTIARPLPTPTGATGQWVVVIDDVTQERALHAQLQQQERLAAVGQLAAGIAHDFNNILAVITLQGSLAAQTPALPARVGERLTVINDQAIHATRLIQQVLDFSRRAVLERRLLDLAALLQEQVALLVRTLPEHIAVTLDYGPEDYVVLADATRIQQMVMNLAVNARDAMPHGGRLRLSLARTTQAPHAETDQRQWVCLTIADTGTGIPPEIMAHMFEPFFTTKEPGRGTGLGLAQVYGIVKQHEGDVAVRSTPGQGATIVIYLPAMSPSVAPAARPAAFQTTSVPARVLLVEDNPLLLEAMSDILTALGCEVVCAGNGQAALAVLDEQGSAIDIVLTDLIMPQLGGDALLAEMRAHGLRTPVVILSGHPLEGELVELKQLGLAGWLLKPPDIKELAQLLASVRTA
jgi:two-component system cell cycle sensor histidine kinase/response regulator CckA